EGPELPGLQAEARRFGVEERVSFVGARPSGEVARLLARSDVMLFPAVGEGLGLAAVEALMAGVPVVVCEDGGGAVETVSRFGGGVVAAPTPEAIGGALRSVLGSPALAALAREAGRRWREALDPARVAAGFETWYREALGRVVS
ncbi:MAG: glycosyltransferase family 4 protein, partial [Gemmatimonadales bacterium]